MKFNLGDKVKINPNSEFYGFGISNPKNTEGEIICLNDAGYPYSVLWSTGFENTYRADDLRLSSEDLIDQTSKPTNPKDALGSDKLPLHLWPATASALGSLALLDGGLKYGRSNFREIGVRASIYFDAASRHLTQWFEGEDSDPDSGVDHLGHALACIAIIVDARAAGKLNDDRMVKGGYRKLVDSLTPHVKRLKELHKAKTPKHYTIKDNK